MSTPVQQSTPAGPNPKTGTGLHVIRLVLGLVGAGIAAYGLLGLPSQLGVAQLVGLLFWLACAVLLHDGLLVPLTSLVGAALNRFTFGLGSSSAAVLRSALMTGAVLTLLTLTLVWAQSVARNTSVLEADYAAHLAWLWLALAIGAAAVIYLLERRTGRRFRRQKTRP
ncbi:hypothetical protein [Paenarthrobacter sp. PH39-S1]|uniref:hypothetical protein n=1 Tax=Paenarthrobacter sp. PH39-S1 TaxID=3046204 RepID=UPI0024BBE2C6|nr:hypothetical protein [Paenarthrobacter sp. PH39-S1]MDJ0355819.1 hypothetical protein [Paenarthrobacter sp. PH39-S1]